MNSEQPLIIYIITQLELGGAQKVCLSLFKGLSTHNLGTKLITGSQGPLMTQVENDYNALFITMQRSLGALSEIKTFIALIRALHNLKRQHTNLIVHTHSSKAGILGRWAAWLCRIPIRIHTIHGFAFHHHQPWYLWWPIYLCELLTTFITTHFVCVSSFDIAQSKKLLPGFSKKYSLIRAAIDWNTFAYTQQALKSADTFIIGTISCFKPQKNLFDLLKAFHYAFKHNSDLRLEVIGDGVLRPLLESWIKEYGLEQVVTLHGWQHNVEPFLQRWHIFTLSSLWEGLPCSIVEARMLKLPVLCYNTGGIADVIEHGKNGFLYNQGDWRALGQGFLEISQQKDLYCQLSHYNDELTAFSDDTMIKEHYQLYTHLVDRRLPKKCA